MPYVKIRSGVLRIASRPGLPEAPEEGYPPDWGLEEGEGGEPGQGLPEGGRPGRPIFPVLPPWFHPGVGLPIPPTVDHPIVPVPPGEEGPGHLPELPPGTIWPPINKPFPPDFGSKYLVAALIFVPGLGYRAHWVVVDMDARPKPPGEGWKPRPEPQPPEMEPKRH
jgi:hypothetical protein